MSFETMLWAIAVIIHGVCVQACPVPKDVIINRRVTAPARATIKIGCEPPKCKIKSVKISGGSGSVILTIHDPTGGDLMQDDPSPLCRVAGSTSVTCKKTSGGNYITKGTSFWVVLSPPENDSFENVKVTVTLDGSDPKILLFGADLIINRRITAPARVMIMIGCDPPKCKIASVEASGGSGSLELRIIDLMENDQTQEDEKVLCQEDGSTSASCENQNGGNYITKGEKFWVGVTPPENESFENVRITVTLDGSDPKILRFGAAQGSKTIADAAKGADQLNK